MSTITQTASGHDIAEVTSPHLWRKAVTRGFEYVYERGGMRDMPHDLYAVAMHLGNAELMDGAAAGRPGILLRAGHGWHIAYSPIPVTSIVATTATQVRLILRLLVALGYLRIVSAPRPGRGGEGVYELTEPVDGRGPDIPAAFGILDKAARTPSRRGADMTAPNRAKRRATPVDNPGLGYVPAPANSRAGDHLNGRADDYSNGRADDHFEDATPYMGFRGSGTTGINGVPGATTDAVDNGPGSRQEGQEEGEGEIGAGIPTAELAKATLRSVIQEVQALREDVAAVRRRNRGRRVGS